MGIFFKDMGIVGKVCFVGTYIVAKPFTYIKRLKRKIFKKSK